MAPRLFIAIRPPEDVRTALLARMGELVGARWQNDAQLHLTLRYVGETAPALAEDLVEALAQIRFDPFAINLRGAGWFEKRGQPHTLWAGVEASEDLQRLQRKVERCCTALGLPAEARRYQPHVTLARLNAASGPPAPFCAALADRPLGRWCCRSYWLYESHLRPEGSLYEPVRVYRAAII